MRKNIFVFFSILICVAGSATQAAAQQSFSSLVRILNGDNSTMQTYRGARLYTEDGQSYYLRAYGCESRLETRSSRLSVGDSQYLSGLNRSVGRTGRFETGSHTMLYAAILVDTRPVSFSEVMPGNVNCAQLPNKTRAVMIGRYSYEDGASYASVSALESDYDPQTGDKRAFTMSLFLMEADFFTPRTEQQALQIGGEVALALFRAWARGR